VGLPPPRVRRYAKEGAPGVGWKMTTTTTATVDHPHAARTGPAGASSARCQDFHENLANGAFEGTASGAWNYALEPMRSTYCPGAGADVGGRPRSGTAGLAQLQTTCSPISAAPRQVQDGRVAARLYTESADAPAHAASPQGRGERARRPARHGRALVIGKDVQSTRPPSG